MLAENRMGPSMFIGGVQLRQGKTVEQAQQLIDTPRDRTAESRTCAGGAGGSAARGDAEGTVSEPGIGPGLAISHALAVQMAGTLTVESSAAGGSSFIIRLPMDGQVDGAR